jgi:outer membrane protein OmpA-like peptidoglycan-associated protein
LDIVRIDKNIILAQANQLSRQEMVELRRENDALDTKYREHKWNNAKKIEKLLGIKSEEYQSKKGLKAIQDIGGSYKADLLFDKNSFWIKDTYLTQEIIDVISSEIAFNPDALFGLEGATSSEGDSALNKKLSLKRANALKKAILKRYPNYKANIKTFAMGESDLVCEGGLLPERDEMGEYRCLTAENRIESRKVTIRRLR